ncbi:MAG TPA: glycoside hydrolase family 125 protein [Acidisarcina sp.]
MLTRRDMVKLGVLAATQNLLPRSRASQARDSVELRSARPAPAKRQFRSEAVEREIGRVRELIADSHLALLFENCYPNTLDTTVFPSTFEGKPDTFVITGDIAAMWLRDSGAQVWPYLPLAAQDRELRNLLEGVIRRQTRCILIDPYANAFSRDTSAPPLSFSLHDDTRMLPGVAERKWEIDSLCYPIRLAHGYWRATGDTSPFDEQWRVAMHLVVATFRAQQRKSSEGPYRFLRLTETPNDTLQGNGYGAPASAIGLIHSAFRPSDDACMFPFLIPSNLFAVKALGDLAQMATEVLGDRELATDATTLAAEVRHALQWHGMAHHGIHGKIWAYEVDGFGNALFSDDANIPSLLALPYLGCVRDDDPVYLRTRRFVLSPDNPYFFKGTAAEGVGGPHIGVNQIWPMSIIVRALTSRSQVELLACLRWLRNIDAGTGFMHESFDKDDPAKFTRPWFAWANTLFGELIVKVSRESPSLLASDL